MALRHRTHHNKLWILLLVSWTTAAQPSPSSSAAPMPLETYSRKNVMLPCEAPKGTDLQDMALEWTKPGMKPLYVFLFRDGRPYLVFQHDHFKDRVTLADPNFKRGDLSLILHDADQEDSGLYECHVFSKSHVRKRAVFDTEPVKVINLKVLGPEPKQIEVLEGQDAVFSMEPLDFSVSSFMWKRADDDKEFVFLVGMGHPHHQHPQYSNRVELVSPDRSGDMSVRLKGVQPSDSGTYHCHVVQSRRRKRDTHESEPYNVIELKVLQSGAFRSTAGAGLLASVLFSVFLLMFQ